MGQHTRRQFVTAIGAVAGPQPTRAASPETAAGWIDGESLSLNGTWRFRLDPQNSGEASGWHRGSAEGEGWTEVVVPHTWQIDPEHAGYTGKAWYCRELDVPAAWRGKWLRIEFEAVYHTARVWVDGQPVGSHERKGYTAFCVDITPAVRYGERNMLAIQVDNSFRGDMLPRSDSYDWTMDGGVTRPVNVLVTPPVFIERIDAGAEPDLGRDEARLSAHAVVRNTSDKPVSVRVAGEVIEEETGLRVAQSAPGDEVMLAAGSRQEVPLREIRWSKPRLWHFDHPHLYRLEARLEAGGEPGHAESTTFGVRAIEVRGTSFYLNGERVRLIGVERMAGSNPEYGMAEPESWIVHDHDDMKELNCVFTRVHWQQDRRVLDYCDRHGMLIQIEVPTWGPKTFSDMGGEPSAEIMQNGLEQLREMIERDRNHPCIFSWGLCNEVNGQNPAAQKFVRRMYEEAKRLDPSRPLTYASNSLQKNPERDVAGEMDFVMWNEYYESWMGGDVPAMKRNLEEIHRAFPNKPIVISEYGYCECRPSHKGGDPKRIDILKEHTRVFREFDYVAGAIFFDYNDYRTHIGDKGIGPLKQRVHGVVDVYGNRKPSFDDLRRESSPLERIEIARAGEALEVTLITSRHIPAYTLDGYTLRWIVYGFGGLPMETGEAKLPRLKPGDRTSVKVHYKETGARRVQFDVMRPTRFSVATARWEM